MLKVVTEAESSHVSSSVVQGEYGGAVRLGEGTGVETEGTGWFGG